MNVLRNFRLDKYDMLHHQYDFSLVFDGVISEKLYEHLKSDAMNYYLKHSYSMQDILISSTTISFTFYSRKSEKETTNELNEILTNSGFCILSSFSEDPFINRFSKMVMNYFDLEQFKQKELI